MRRPHENLKAWQASVGLVTKLYKATESFPEAERFGLTTQICRAGVSIPANLAEGAARGSDPDYLRFVRISRGSLSELETLLLIAYNLRFLDQEIHRELLKEAEAIGRCIEGLIRRLREGKASEEGAAYMAED